MALPSYTVEGGHKVSGHSVSTYMSTCLLPIFCLSIKYLSAYISISKYMPDACLPICEVGRENVPLVAESEAEKITIIHQAVIY